MISTTRKPATFSATFSDPCRFISRELSWLDFNSRVLEEAGISGNPLLERLKFIAIFSSNLDEFFMVRIAGLRQLVRAGADECDPAGKTPSEQLALAHKKITAMLKIQYQLLHKILTALEKEGIFICRFSQLDEKTRSRMRRIFEQDIHPALTPLAVGQDQHFPLLNSGAQELAVKVHYPKSGKTVTAFVEVPELLSRFIPIPGENQHFLLLEDLIAENLVSLFPGGRIMAVQLFRVTRDMDYSIDPEDSEDLLHALQDKLRRRSSRAPVRLEFSAVRSDRELQKYLSDALALEPESCYTLPGALHLKQYFSLAEITGRNDLTEAPWQPVVPSFFSKYDSVFDAVSAKKNILLLHPYHSFDPIIRLLESAAEDPAVVAIKQTLYRVSGNSPVIKALRRAAENGKQVTVVVELKARFDESNNIAWAELLDHSGAHVVYGQADLKIHSKSLLIVRRENGKLRRYVHFGTGNYNDRTATLYTDVSLLSCDTELADDAAGLFNLLSGGSEPPDKWSAVSVAPFDLRQTFIRLIKKETALGKKGRIVAKMNSFSDPELISLIHHAADSGVKIDLIVRGICCCRPQPHQKNLRIISIIDRFLEHSRIYCFGSEEKIYCSSADWMPRNLDRRVETMFPVRDPALKAILQKVLLLHIADKGKQRRLTAAGRYTRPADRDFNDSRSQRKIYELCRDETDKTENRIMTEKTPADNGQ